MSRCLILIAAIAALTVGLSTQATGQTPAQCPPGANQNPAFCNTPCPPGTTNTELLPDAVPARREPARLLREPRHRPEADARR